MSHKNQCYYCDFFKSHSSLEKKKIWINLPLKAEEGEEEKMTD